MTNSNSQKLISLLTLQAEKNISSAQLVELKSLLGGAKVTTNNAVKDDKLKFAKACEKTEKQAKNIMREAIKQINTLYADADLIPVSKNKSISISYSSRCNIVPSAKNIEIKLISHSNVKQSKKAEADKLAAKELKEKINSEKERIYTMHLEKEAIKLVKRDLKKANL